MPITLPTQQELYQGPLGVHGQWIVANVVPYMPWPVRTTPVEFRGRSLFIVPPTTTTLPEGSLTPTLECYPAVAMMLAPGERYEAGQVLIFQFLSSLSWIERRGVSIPYWSGGGLPRPMGGRLSHPIYTEEFYKPYLPDPQDRKTRWALAFYREGLALNNPAYQCLSFFKVLNILRDGPAQIAWMNANLGTLTDHRAKARAALLQNQVNNIGEYLYGSNRCAVAHAGGTPTADPEDPDDIRCLTDDLPLAQNFAELSIELDFGVQSAMTVYRQHLYEIAGFKSLLGDELVARLSHGEAIPEVERPRFPRLGIRLHFADRYEGLEALPCQIVEMSSGKVVLHAKSQTGYTEATIHLDFEHERLLLDPFGSLSSFDDGSPAAAAEALSVARFQLDLFKNGILEVWDIDSNRMLGRREAYLPTNVDYLSSIDDMENNIRALQAMLERRRLAAQVGTDIEP